MNFRFGICVWALIGLPLGAAQSANSRIAGAAKVFLATLDETQRKSVLFAFDDEQQRKRWSNLPTGVVPRSGVSLKEMNAAQRSAAMAVVAAALSARGMEEGRADYGGRRSE